jgi:hypothetical protein
MEIVKILWIIKFFFFTLVLFFIWSKINVISNKIKAITSSIEDIKKLESEDSEAVETVEEPVENEES